MMPWSPPTVAVDSLTLELAEDSLREAGAKMRGAIEGYKGGYTVLMRYSDAQDVRDEINRVAETLRRMRDGPQR